MILTRPFRKPFWLVESFFEKHKKIIGLAAIVGIGLFLITKNLLTFLPKLKPTQKIGLIGQYSFKSLPGEITQKISRGLTKIDVTGLPQPDLAENWEIDKNQTTYRIFLKKNNLWTDGSQIKAKDISFDMPDVELKIIDDYTLEFKLKESFSPFLTILSRPLFKKNIYGAGNFTIKSIRYSGAYLKTLELSGLDQNLTYRFYPSQEAAWLGFRLGEVNLLSKMLVNPLSPNWNNKINLVNEINSHQYLAVIFNLNNNYLSQKSLRQALAYAIEFKSATPASRAFSPINPDSWAYNPKVKPYDYNPDQARDLKAKFLSEATVSGELIISLATSQAFLGLAEKIAKSWEEVLGIKTQVKIVSSIEPDFEALLITQEIPADPDQHALWHSTQDTNITHYSELKIDKLLEDGRKIADQTKRKEIYQDFQKFLVEDTPAIFLEHPTTYTISR